MPLRHAIAIALTSRMRQCGMRITAAVLIVLCASLHAAPPAPVADPVLLFSGRSTGVGELRILRGRPRPFRVESLGRHQPDGSFRLDQRLRFEDGPVRERHWILRQTAPGRYVFSLSDAAGMGTAEAHRGRLTLRYPLGRGLSIRQVLVPTADGHRIANTGTIRWLGLPVGRLTETITREAPVDAGGHR